MGRVLITGADGFTGRHLCRSLHAAGHEVHALVRQAPSEPMTSIFGDAVQACHVADLLQPQALGVALEQAQPDRVIHLAAIAFVAHGNVTSLYQTNLLGTRNLLEAIAVSTVPVPTLLASSANVYGNATAGVLTESTPPSPANDYAVSKLAMEYIANIWRGRLPITVVRPFNYTGKGQSKDFVVAKVIDHVLRRADSIELGNLDVERDFSDVRTVVDAYTRLISMPDMPQGPFNVCSGHGYSLRYLIDLACELAGHRPEIRVNPAFVRANEVHRLTGDPSALEAAIGTLQHRTMRDTLAWMLS